MRLIINIARKVCIFGSSLEGIRIFYNMKDTYETYFVDNNYSGYKNGNYKIYSYEESKAWKPFYIIATGNKAYYEIRKQLLDDGFVENIDFTHYIVISKKKHVMLHGNCHMGNLLSILKKNESFNELYDLFPFTPIQNMDSLGCIEGNLKYVDVFVSQDIRNDNGLCEEFSLDSMREKLSHNTRMIIFPNLFGYGRMFFPQFIDNYNNRGFVKDRNGLFPHGDSVIDECINNNISSVSEIYDLIKEKPIRKDIIESLFFGTLEKLRIRNKNWDIDIFTFIKDNYRKIQLFYDRGHPTEVVMKYMANELLKLLNINTGIISDIEPMDDHEEFIYPCVKDVLGLEYSQELIRKSSKAKKLAEKMDMKEYIKEYIWWIYSNREIENDESINNYGLL